MIMKKNNLKSSQTTLFQSWGKTGSKPKLKNVRASLFQTWDKSASKPLQDTGTSYTLSTNEIRSSKDEGKLDDIINIEDDDDDKELLAAVDRMDSFTFEHRSGESNQICQNGNLSFSARPCTPDDLTENEVIRGFDSSAGNSWIFPTNYPIRDYQFNIVEKALFQNTLVTLPTGLGKTFIAAVVMYNFYRWYPQGKIIFMAPTKPLVAQQIDACYNIMGIPQEDTAEMTGNMAPSKREHFWTKKRVLFLTPQVFQNDLSRGSCRAEDVVCLVIDEAHKALGNHAYCQVVRELFGYNQQFRVLALSATPGDGIKAVQQVITNLLVSHIELRSEDSADIKPYTHQRQVEKIVIKLGEELEFFKKKFLRVLNVVVNRLAANQVIWHRDTERISKYMLLTAREQFRKACANGNQSRTQMGSIEGDFAVAISFYHAYELLLQHGLLPFYNFMKGIVDGTKGSSRAKTELTRSPDFVAIMEDLREQIELPPDQCQGNVTMFAEVSPKGMSPRNRPKINPSFVGHPKLNKLKEIVLEHFRKYETFNCMEKKTDSRVMIFSQFRDSVQEIASMFSAHKPLVRVMSFIGQQSRGNSSKGLTQKEQLEVIRKFRNGGYNTLVATCVGEEGLDIGEVDLIICFDASASPIRLVQRMGRTGRRRAGRIIVLVTEGKEEQIYQKSQRNKTNIHKSILESARTLDLYLENPRMVPKNVNPVCQKMYITVENKSPKKSKPGKSGRKTSAGTIKKLLSAGSTCRRDDGFLSPQELRYWQENFKLPDHEAGLTPSRSFTMRSRVHKSSDQRQTEHALSLTEWVAWQTTLQPFSFVDHSKRAQHFTEILEFCDFRRDCGENDGTYDLEMHSFLNNDDIMRPDGEKAHEETGTGECQVESGIGKQNGQLKKDRKKTAKRTVNVNNGDDDGNSRNQEESGAREGIGTTGMTGDLGEPDSGGASARTKDTVSNASESCLKVKWCGKKRKSIDLDCELDDDFEDVRFSSTTNDGEVKDRSFQEVFSHQTLRDDSVSRKDKQESKDSEDSSSEHDLLKLIDVPCSQRQQRRKDDDKPTSQVLPDAPSLETLHDLSALNTGEYSQVNSCPSDLCTGAVPKYQDPTAFQRNSAAETPKTSKSTRNILRRKGGDSWKHAVKGDLFRARAADETTNEEDGGGPMDHVATTVNSEKSNESEKVNISILSEDREKSGTTGATLKKRWDELECTHSTPRPKDVGKILRNEEENVGLGILEDSPCEGPALFGSGLVCDAETPSRKDDKIDFDFDQEFGHSFFADEDVLQDFQTPCLFDDDFGSKEPSDRKKTSVKAFANENTIHTIVSMVKGITSKDETDGEVDTAKGFTCSKSKTARVDSAKGIIDKNVASEKVGAVKASENENKTHEMQGKDSTNNKTSRTIEVDPFKKDAHKSIVGRGNSSNILSKEKSADRRVNALGSFARNEITNNRLTVVDDLGRTDGEKDSVKCLPSQNTLVKSDAIHVCSSRGKESLQNGINWHGCSELTKHVEEKQTGTVDRSLTKIRSFTFEKTDTCTKLSKLSNYQSSKPRDSARASPRPSLLDEDSDLVAPSPHGVCSRRFCYISSKIDHKSRNAEPKDESMFSEKKPFSEKLEDTELSAGRIQTKVLKLRCKTKVSSGEIKSSQGFCNVAEVEERKSAIKISSRMPTTPPNALHEEREEFSGCHGSTDSEPGHESESAEIKGDSPFLIKRTKKKNCKAFGAKVLESDEGRERKDTKQVDHGSSMFKDDESLVFRGEFSKRSSFGDFGNQVKRLLTDSDDEFEDKREKTNRKRKPPTNREPMTSKKSKPQGKRIIVSEFLEHEAEVSDDIDGFDSSDEELGGSTDEFEASFIDDRTQLTQVSPITMETQKKRRQPVDMMEIYQKSLLTPHRKQLRFHTPAFHHSRNRYKLVFNKDHHDRSSSSSQADGDERDFSEEVGEFCESDGGDISEREVVGEISVSPEESQVVVRKNRHRTKRILADSDFESPEVSTLPEQQPDVSWKNKSPGTASSYSREAPVEMEKLEREHVRADSSKISVKSHQSFSVTGNNVFNCPDSRSSNRPSKVIKEKTGDPTGCGENEEINDILAALENSDESLMMGMNEIPSFSFGSGIRTSNTSTVNKVRKTNLFSNKSDRHYSPRDDLNKWNVTKSSTSVNTNENVDDKITISNNAGRTNIFAKTSNKQRISWVGALEKNNKTAVCSPNQSSTSEKMTSIDEPGRRGNKSELSSNSKSFDKFSWKENGIRTEVLAYQKHELSNSLNQNMVTSCRDETGDERRKISPLYPPLSTNSSSLLKETDSYTDVSPDRRTKLSSFDKATTAVAPDGRKNGEKTATTSPSLTPLQRDKNKLTILVGSREVSNCQIVSFLRRKHNIKAVVCQITGCDYIVSNRMGVERRLVSDISNPTNTNKLTERVRELCDLYDRPCLVIEKDRLKQGETENKPEVRTKYFNRVLACLAQTHVKVLFSDSQEGTSNILASLVQIEAKKDAAIIYPLPLSKDREQAVRFLSSIPRTSYVTAVSLCYHNRTLKDVVSCSAEDLVRRTKGLSLKRANDILKFLNHTFCVDMVSKGNT